MTYIIAEKPGGDTALYHAENRYEADQIVQTIVDQIKRALNPEFLKITKKEDDVLVKWSGNLFATIKVREDDEVDVTAENKKSL